MTTVEGTDMLSFESDVVEGEEAMEEEEGEEGILLGLQSMAYLQSRM